MLSASACVWEVMGLNIDLDTLNPDYSFFMVVFIASKGFPAQ